MSSKSTDVYQGNKWIGSIDVPIVEFLALLKDLEKLNSKETKQDITDLDNA